ncbi:MAG TPA: PAS domain S-box protein [Candidatus Kapabacteria bacterium]|nr:PAS domain S-box protein [Candidatus Kapabacteria bacterium]
MITKTIEIIEKAMESAQLAFWQIEFPSGKVVFSQRKPELFGVKIKNEATYQEMIELVHPDDIERVKSDLKEHLSGKTNGLLMEFRVKSLSESKFIWLRVIGRIVEKLEEKHTIMGIAFNITEEKHTAFELEDIEKKYDYLFNSLTDAVLIYDADGNILEINQAMADRYGYSKSEFLKLNLSELIRTEKTNNFLLKDISNGNHIITFESEFYTKNDFAVPVELICKQIDFKHKSSILCIARDVTDLKKHHKLLSENEQKYRAILKQSLDGIFLIDITTKRIIETNESFIKTLGYSELELYKMNLYDFIAHSKDSIDKNVQTLIEKGSIHIKERHYKAKDGRIIIVEVLGSLIKYYGKEVLCFTCRDITERKLNEERLHSQYIFLNTLSTITGLDDILKYCLFSIINNTGMDCGGIYLVDKATGDLKLIIHNNLSSEFLQHSSHYNSDSSRAKIVKEGKTILSQHSKFTDNSLELDEGILATSVVPLTYQNEVIGCINIGSHKKENVPEDMKQYLESLAAACSSFIAKAIIEEELASEIIRRRVLVNQSKDGIVVLDENGRAFESNLKFSEMLGYSLAEMDSLYVWDWDTRWSKEELLEIIKKVTEEGDFFETKHKRKDNSFYDVEISTNAAYINGKKFIFCLCRDITERKLIESELKEAVQQLQIQSTILDILPASIIIYDFYGNILYVNNTASQFHSLTKEELSYKNIKDIYSPEYKSLFEKRILELKEKGKINYNVSLQNNIGNRFELLVNSALVNWKDRTVIINIETDISEIESTKVTLIKTEEKYRNLVENINEAMYIFNEKGYFVYMSPSVFKITGNTSDYYIGKHIFDVVYEEDIEKIKQSLIDLEINNLHPTEYRIKTKSNSLLWIRTNTKLIIDNNGKKSYHGMAHNIDEKKKYELELINAKEKAEESERLKTAFLRNVTHELRTPLNGIIGFSTLLQENTLDEDTKLEYLFHLRNAADRLTTLINNVIGIAMIETKQINVYFAYFDVKGLVEDLHSMFVNLAAQNKIEFEYKIDETKDILINSDRKVLYDALMCIIDNAFKFTDEGKIGIYCYTKEDYLIFEIKDTGIGISEDDQKRVFNKFEQIDNTRTRVHLGVGIGLSIAKGLVELVNGKIEFTSEVGIGSSFKVLLPASIIQSKNKQIKNLATPSVIENEQSEILIVEDDPTSMIYYKSTLKNSNFNIHQASTGDEAINICKNNPNIKVVLMDLNLPDITGYEAMQQIKQINRNISFIAQTAYTVNDEEFNNTTVAFDGYLSKPISKSVLINEINRLLSKLS